MGQDSGPEEDLTLADTEQVGVQFQRSDLLPYTGENEKSQHASQIFFVCYLYNFKQAGALTQLIFSRVSTLLLIVLVN